ncbi:hypothetical protein [Pseudoalteromonas sp. NZS11]|uniref:hypothetical protein n=1 Tax=Pseudoalteromonas sp. NZS11 TaxID=2792049 RepID=UPI0018CEB6D4|nr:hypothetical protein [Pseudoalteromonas sp. NZS11]MBH0080183.1 hypothetical protein [Pseudoalteromonas sp. NZS11]
MLYSTTFVYKGNTGGSAVIFDSRIKTELEPVVFSCRYCDSSFSSDDLRVRHEWEEHPTKNPTFRIKGSEITSSRFYIRDQVSIDEIELSNVQKVFINDVETDIEDLHSCIFEKPSKFLKVELVNRQVQKTFELEVSIPKLDEIEKVDEYFWLFLSRDDFTEELIDQFIKSTSELKSVTWYVDGLVKYLQGIMAKDGKTKFITFEDHEIRFNQARNILSTYASSLAHAVVALIDFNQNYFSDNTSKRTLPYLDRALIFFTGNDCNNSLNKIPDSVKSIPTDRITSLILECVCNEFTGSSLEFIQQQVLRLRSQTLTVQDRSKLDYILFRKATLEGDTTEAEKCRKKLKYNEVFDLSEFDENC